MRAQCAVGLVRPLERRCGALVLAEPGLEQADSEVRSCDELVHARVIAAQLREAPVVRERAVGERPTERVGSGIVRQGVLTELDE